MSSLPKMALVVWLSYSEFEKMNNASINTELHYKILAVTKFKMCFKSVHARFSLELLKLNYKHLIYKHITYLKLKKTLTLG